MGTGFIGLNLYSDYNVLFIAIQELCCWEGLIGKMELC